MGHEIDPDSIGQYSLVNINSLVGPPVTLIKTEREKCMIKIKEYYNPIV